VERRGVAERESIFRHFPEETEENHHNLQEEEQVCLPSAEPTTYPNKTNPYFRQPMNSLTHIHRGNHHKETCRGGMEVNTATVKLSHFLTAPCSCSETALFSSSTLNQL
jgi:hypothetical protein